MAVGSEAADDEAHAPAQETLRSQFASFSWSPFGDAKASALTAQSRDRGADHLRASAAESRAAITSRSIVCTTCRAR